MTNLDAQVLQERSDATEVVKLEVDILAQEVVVQDVVEQNVVVRLGNLLVRVVCVTVFRVQEMPELEPEVKLFEHTKMKNGEEYFCFEMEIF